MKQDILKHVDILDLIELNLYQTTLGHFVLDVVTHDKSKRAVFDEKALNGLNNRLTERAKSMSLKANDPNAHGYLKEFCGRMISELYRSGLVELEDVPDADIDEDPYKQFKRNLKDGRLT